jgi:photosystem II stability/assembly factor-like uncharacterized protein
VIVRLAVALLLALPAVAERWQLQYFYDEDRSSLAIRDLQFISEQRGVAIAMIQEGNRERPTAVVTSDGGTHWSPVPLKEPGISLFFLSENLGWMVTTKGLWQTTEAGRSWRKLPRAPSGLLRVHFLDEKRGFAVGARKGVYETEDGGAHWKPVLAAAEPKTSVEYTTYVWIAFANPQIGFITGWSQPPRREARLPEWIDPERRVPELPHLSITLETRDGGRKWTPQTVSHFGRMTRFRFGPHSIALTLLEFARSFTLPSEVYQISWLTGKMNPVFREKERAITDIWLTSSGTAYLAGVEAVGMLRENPIPSRVKILRSSDMKTWQEIPVDYRAVATRTVLSGVGERSLWAATDTGMILKLVD